jgi:hypothetical protein
MGWKRGRCVLTVWQMPEYFISIRNSSLRISSRMMGVRVKGALGASTTKASVSMFVVWVVDIVALFYLQLVLGWLLEGQVRSMDCW